jgi:hypothetical protein
LYLRVSCVREGERGEGKELDRKGWDGMGSAERRNHRRMNREEHTPIPREAPTMTQDGIVVVLGSGMGCGEGELFLWQS